MKKFLRLCAALLGAILLTSALAACGIRIDTGRKEKDKPYVVCTIFPQYDFVRNIAGDLVEVELLVPAGSETHTFGLKDISITKLDELHSADLLIGVGGESDEEFLGELRSVLPEKVNFLQLVDLVDEKLEELETAGMKVEGEDEHDEHDDHDEDGEDGEFDEHVWTSPKRAIEIVEKLRDALCDIDPDNAEAYRANAAAYTKKLRYLDNCLKEVSMRAGIRTLIFADRFPFRYLCYDYGFEADAAFQGCSSSIEPSLATLDYLYEKAKQLNVPAVLYMEGSKPEYARQLASRVGAQALLLHSCHMITEEEFQSESYFSLMEKNVAVLMTALKA